MVSSELSSEDSVTALFYSRDITRREGAVLVIGLLSVIGSGNVREEKV